jgi:hypothetical protein
MEAQQKRAEKFLLHVLDFEESKDGVDRVNEAAQTVNYLMDAKLNFLSTKEVACVKKKVLKYLLQSIKHQDFEIEESLFDNLVFCTIDYLNNSKIEQLPILGLRKIKSTEKKRIFPRKSPNLHKFVLKKIYQNKIKNYF